MSPLENPPRPLVDIRLPNLLDVPLPPTPVPSIPISSISSTALPVILEGADTCVAIVLASPARSTSLCSNGLCFANWIARCSEIWGVTPTAPPVILEGCETLDTVLVVVVLPVVGVVVLLVVTEVPPEISVTLTEETVGLVGVTVTVVVGVLVVKEVILARALLKRVFNLLLISTIFFK